MSCPDPVALSRALASGLDDVLRAHLHECARCAAELESHARVSGAVKSLEIIEPAADHAYSVRASLLAAARVPAPAARSWVLWGAGGAAVLAAAGLALVLGLRTSGAPDETVAVGPVYRGAIHAHDGARFVRVGSAPDEIVRLMHGTLTVEVAKLHPGERFRVVTDDGEVEVRGTAFDVSADGDHLRAVRVLHGRVEVRPAQAQVVVLDIGERWDAPRLARVEPPVEEPAIEPPVIEPPPMKLRAPDRPAPSAAPRTPQLSSRPAPSAVKRPIELLFDEGWAALAAGDPRKAALVFERAARAAPADPLAEDAWFWRASALARSGNEVAVGALDAFLASYPRSPRAGEAAAVLGWLILERDTARAELLFRAASTDRVPAVRASGTKGLAAVEQRRGQPKNR